ncbi:MAG: hypothetical protein RH917_12430 [Lacipirellulaceae bacterium]
MNQSHRQTRKGFTLLEIVLALGLAAMLLYLLTMATELTIFRVDRSRARVESAQVARAILDTIADDLQNARFDSPRSSLPGSITGGTSVGGLGAQQGGTTSGADASSASSIGNSAVAVGGSSDLGTGFATLDASTVRGIYGDQQLLRIDRCISYDWHDATRPAVEEEQDTTSPNALPQTVFYTVEDGERLTAPESAERGVQSESQRGIAGLYRESLSTQVVQAESATDGTSNYQRSEQAKLLAPEVVSIEYGYFDGSEMLDQWDTVERTGLPRGIEIRLKVLEVAYEEAIEESDSRADRYREEDSVEYRRFVSLVGIQQQAPMPMLLGQPRQNAAGFGGFGTGSGSTNAGGASNAQATGGGGDE